MEIKRNVPWEGRKWFRHRLDFMWTRSRVQRWKIQAHLSPHRLPIEELLVGGHQGNYRADLVKVVLLKLVSQVTMHLMVGLRFHHLLLSKSPRGHVGDLGVGRERKLICMKRLLLLMGLETWKGLGTPHSSPRACGGYILSGSPPWPGRCFFLGSLLMAQVRKRDSASWGCI